MPITTKPVGPVDPAKSIEVLQSLFNRGTSGQQFTSATPVAASEQRDKQIDEMSHNLDLEKQMPGRFATGATPSDLSSLQADAKADPWTGDSAQVLSKFFNPEQQRMEAQKQKAAIDVATAPQKVAGEYGIRQEQAKSQGALDLDQQKRQGVQQTLQTLQGANGGANGIAGPGGSIKPAINANGGVSFTVSQMPDMVRRAHAQLGDARDKTVNALAEAERMYPGITQTAGASDKGEPTGWGSFLAGGQKYGGASDLLGAANERLKYTLGVPTPFSKLAQEASFGNIEQMAGQLPGVRGLATIAPMFKEHQSRWGHETPLATVQRLRHMLSMMNETIGGMEHGDNNTESAPTDLEADPTNDPLGLRQHLQ